MNRYGPLPWRRQMAKFTQTEVRGLPLNQNDPKFRHLKEPGVYVIDDCPLNPDGYVARLHDGSLFNLGLAQERLLSREGALISVELLQIVCPPSTLTEGQHSDWLAGKLF